VLLGAHIQSDEERQLHKIHTVRRLQGLRQQYEQIQDTYSK